MKKSLLLPLLFLALSFTRAQDRLWSVEGYYPVSIGETFGASNQGLYGLGFKYKLGALGKWKLGASLDGSWFSTEFVGDSDPPIIDKVRDLFIQPRFYTALPLTKKGKLQLLAGLGWTIYRVSEENFIGTQSMMKEINWNSGLNANAGLSLDVSSRWFVATQFDQILSSGDSPDRTIGLMKLGAGFRF